MSCGLLDSLFSLTLNLMPLPFLLVLLWSYTQNPTTSLHIFHFHPNSTHHHFSPPLLPLPPTAYSPHRNHSALFKQSHIMLLLYSNPPVVSFLFWSWSQTILTIIALHGLAPELRPNAFPHPLIFDLTFDSLPGLIVLYVIPWLFY